MDNSAGAGAGAGAEADFAWKVQVVWQQAVGRHHYRRMRRKFIADAVNCVSFADEVLVVDCGSTDKTCGTSQKSSVPGVARLGCPGSGALKNKVVKLAHNDWVFVLKVNERITSERKLKSISTLLGTHRLLSTRRQC